MPKAEKKELFESVPVPKALLTMAVPTIISQLVNLIYNVVDAFFIGRTGNSYMMAATTLALTLTMMNVALSNMFGIGGGSLFARLMGAGENESAGSVSAFSCYGAMAMAVFYSLLIGLFSNPILFFLGASEATIGFARQYVFCVIVIGNLPVMLSLTLAHILRNAGYSGKAAQGLSGGGILNILLDPLFMFVILPKGNEVLGAAIATLLSNTAACLYLLSAYRKASAASPLTLSFRKAKSISSENIRRLFAVGVPSSLLLGLFDLANICLNILAASHGDLVLAGMGIVMKVERFPNAFNVGICQGMLPIVAYNYSSGNRQRMRQTIRLARRCGLVVAAASLIVLFTYSAPLTHVFLSTKAGDAASALTTVGLASAFLRIRCFASPVQFLNFHTSFCMQAMGEGRRTLMHTCFRQLVCYIPLMFLLNRFSGEKGLASALPVSEALGAAFALFLLHGALAKRAKTP